MNKLSFLIAFFFANICVAQTDKKSLDSITKNQQKIEELLLKCEVNPKNKDDRIIKTQVLEEIKNSISVIENNSLLIQTGYNNSIKTLKTLVASFSTKDGKYIINNADWIKMNDNANKLLQITNFILVTDIIHRFQEIPLKAIESSLKNDSLGLGVIINKEKGLFETNKKAKEIETIAQNLDTTTKKILTDLIRLFAEQKKLIEEKCKINSTTDCSSVTQELEKKIAILEQRIIYFQKDSIRLREEYVILRDSIKNTVTTISKTTDSIVNTENTIIKDIETLQTEINSLKKDDSTKHIIQLFNASNGLWSVSYSYRLKPIFLCATLGTFFVANNKSFIAALGIGKTYRQFNFESGLLYLHRKNVDLQDKKSLNLYTKVSVVLPSKKNFKFVPSLSFSPAYGIAVGGGIGF